MVFGLVVSASTCVQMARANGQGRNWRIRGMRRPPGHAGADQGQAVHPGYDLETIVIGDVHSVIHSCSAARIGARPDRPGRCDWLAAALAAGARPPARFFSRMARCWRLPGWSGYSPGAAGSRCVGPEHRKNRRTSSWMPLGTSQEPDLRAGGGCASGGRDAGRLADTPACRHPEGHRRTRSPTRRCCTAAADDDAAIESSGESRTVRWPCSTSTPAHRPLPCRGALGARSPNAWLRDVPGRVRQAGPELPRPPRRPARPYGIRRRTGRPASAGRRPPATGSRRPPPRLSREFLVTPTGGC